MVVRLQMPLAVHNLHGGPEKNRSRRHRSIKLFLDAARGGLGGFNELAKSDRAFFKSEARRRNLNVFIHGQDGAVWDPRLITVNKTRVKKIMTGGHVGADGVATSKAGDDDRRVGPNRYGLYLSCSVIGVELDFEFVITHTMARSFTVHRWRQRLFFRSIASLAAGIRKPDGLLIGDMNSKDYIRLPDVLEVPVKTPPTFGQKHYDQILRWGSHIDVTHIRVGKTPSDHDMLVAVVTFYKHERR